MPELTIPEIFNHVAEAHPARDCVVQGGRRVSYAELAQSSNCLANFFAENSLGCHAERSDLQPWQSGQSHVGLLMYNSPEYLLSELAAARARAAAININYRYVDEELLYLFRDADIKALIFHSEFSPQVRSALKLYDGIEMLIQARDGSGAPLVDGAIWLSDILAGETPQSARLSDPSPDDVHILYTGGTTGMPKGVLWRQADIIMAGLGGRRPSGQENALSDFLHASGRSASKMMPAGPFMHASGRWTALSQLLIGNVVVLPEDPRHFDAADIWRTIEREQVAGLNITGDAMARPLIDQLAQKSYDLGAFRVIVSGAAALSDSCKAAFFRALPHVEIIDAMGSSETGPQASQTAKKDGADQTAGFIPAPGTTILDESLSLPLSSDNHGIGWLARMGRIPLGYLGDSEKTDKAFHVVEGVRYAIPGDRARWAKSGMIQLIGRDAATINSGGEKIFAEEVENAIRRNEAIQDVIVCGRPSERWGQEVVAIISLRKDAATSDDQILSECGKHIARYKLPKQIIRRGEIVRSPSGKPDYAWAKAVAKDAGEAN